MVLKSEDFDCILDIFLHGDAVLVLSSDEIHSEVVEIRAWLQVVSILAVEAPLKLLPLDEVVEGDEASGALIERCVIAQGNDCEGVPCVRSGQVRYDVVIDSID